MSRPGALLLLTAGVALMGHYVSPAPETSGDLAEITRISVAPDRDYRGRNDRDLEIIPTFAPTAPALREASSDAGRPEALAIPRPSTWTTVVVTGRSVVSPVRSSRPADPQTRTQLARDLQNELQRVGCYQGEVTGSWNSATRRAMGAFMDRANAVLPYNEPDYVLLALVQSHREVACTAECPSGQLMQDGGRCVPEAIVAQAAKQQRKYELRRTVAERLAAERAREDVAVSAPPESEALPWQQRHVVADPRAEVAIAIAPRPNPLPGRMSIGGPLSPVETGSLGSTSAAYSPRPAMADAPRKPAKYATLQYEPDTDDLLDSDDAAAQPADLPPISAQAAGPKHKAKKSHRSDRESKRRRDAYAYAGKRRRGDPRPGTARFNLMQSLGGVF